MSLKAYAWAWEQHDIKGTDKLVLLALADSADNTGKCWPKQGTIALKAGVHRVTVSKTIARLEEGGESAPVRSVQTRKTNGDFGGKEYYLNLSRVAQDYTPRVAEDYTREQPTATRACSAGLHARVADGYSKEPSYEPSLEPSEGTSPPYTPPRTDLELREGVKAVNRAAGRHGKAAIPYQQLGAERLHRMCRGDLDELGLVVKWLVEREMPTWPGGSKLSLALLARNYETYCANAYADSDGAGGTWADTVAALTGGGHA